MFAIETIYDAAFNSERFPRMIEQLVASFGAQAGFIAWSDPERRSGFQIQHGNDPEWLRRYGETYAAHDILLPHLQAMPEGVCAPAWPLLQTPEVRDSIFYREYLAPQGVVDNLAVNLIKRPSIVAHLALIRRDPAPRFSDADCARLTALLPHLRRAIYIQSHLVRAAEHAAGDRASFGGGGNSVLLLGAGQRVLDADTALIDLLRLRIGEPLGDGRLGTAALAAIQTGEPVALKLDAGEPCLLIEAQPIDTGRFGDLAAGPGATHALHVTRVDQPRAIAFPAIGAFYGLTATELRVLRDSIEMGDITAVGDRLGMARATARTHLHRIYEKTGSRSFAGLSNLVHRFGRIAPPKQMVDAPPRSVA